MIIEEFDILDYFSKEAPETVPVETQPEAVPVETQEELERRAKINKRVAAFHDQMRQGNNFLAAAKVGVNLDHLEYKNDEDFNKELRAKTNEAIQASKIKTFMDGPKIQEPKPPKPGFFNGLSDTEKIGSSLIGGATLGLAGKHIYDRNKK